MKNNISILLNIVLAIAVSILYFLHFSSSNNQTVSNAISNSAANDSIQSNQVIVTEQPVDERTKPSKIVYLNVDVLNEKYELLNDMLKNIKARQSKLELEYQTKGEKFQKDYADFQQMAQAGIASQSEMMRKEEELKRQNDDIIRIETQLKTLAEEVQTKNEEMYKNVTGYLKEYNKKHDYSFILTYTDMGGNVIFAKDSLDVTNEVLAGLNAEYRKGKK